jgi:hypothetical protein
MAKSKEDPVQRVEQVLRENEVFNSALELVVQNREGYYVVVLFKKAGDIVKEVINYLRERLTSDLMARVSITQI